MSFHVGRLLAPRAHAVVLCIASGLATLSSAAEAQPGPPLPKFGPIDVEFKEIGLFGNSTVMCGGLLRLNVKVSSESGPQNGVIEFNGKSFPFTAKKTAETLKLEAGGLGCLSPLALTAVAKRTGAKELVLASKTYAPKSIEYTQLLKPFGNGSFLAWAQGSCGTPLNGSLASNGLQNQGTGTVKVDGEVIKVTLTGEGTKVPWTATKNLDCSKSLPELVVVGNGLEAAGVGQAGIVASGTMMLKQVTY